MGMERILDSQLTGLLTEAQQLQMAEVRLWLQRKHAESEVRLQAFGNATRLPTGELLDPIRDEI